MKLAACSLSERLGLVAPRPLDSLQDAAVWCTGLLALGVGVVPENISAAGSDSGDGSESDCDVDWSFD